MQHLSKLLADSRIVANVADRPISAITSDSRAVVKDGMYIAITGTKFDGAQYIEDALKRGAAAVVTQAQQAAWSHDVALVEVPDSREAVAALAAAFYPQKPEHLFAITGTDGKTSTADFVRQLSQLLGRDAASIGTLGLLSEHQELNDGFPANNTSPEPILLHKTLQQLAAAGVQHVAIEASSHGLDQKRVNHVKFAAAAFTNLTRDHLDYHGTVEAYAAAKAQLFSQVLPPQATAILNRDDAQFDALNRICASRDITVKSFGYHADADYRILTITPHANGLDATVALLGKTYALSLPLYGAFQLANMLAAIGLLHAVGMDVDALVAQLSKLQGVPGRLEKIASAKCGAPIFVDYAHTPAALENILKTLRAHTQHELHVVFGCGGDRDAGKRPEMGCAAAQFADHVIVTDDNPRSENPAAIRAAILQAAPHAKEIGDRAEAIRVAVQKLEAGDVLVVAGKGHEKTQAIGSNIIHFSDAEQIQDAVRNS